MVLGALAVLVGEKFPASAVKPGAKKAIIEGEFERPTDKDIAQILTEADVDDAGDTVLLRREIAQGGRARCYVNDSPVALDVLLALGERLVDLHGQHEQQALLKRGRHIDFFDAFAGTLALRSDVSYLYREHARLRTTLEKLRKLQEERLQNEGLIRFQLAEIERLNPREGEEEELERDVRKLEGAEQLAQATRTAWEALSNGDVAAEGLLKQAQDSLTSAKAIDPELDALAREISDAAAQIQELGKLARDRHLAVTYNPERLEALRERLHQLANLKRKYKLSAGELQRKAEEWRAVLSETDTLTQDIERTERDVDVSASTLQAKAEELSKKRLAKKDLFERKVTKQLASLGLAGASFEARMDTIEEGGVGLKGLDRTEFYFSANPGGELRPLVEVASGGEASRITLALESVFAGKLEPVTLVFDEIDIGISGRIAERVGDALLTLAQRHQVLAITHLPQIASRATQHFSIVKQTSGGKTVTEVRPLAGEERVQELALLMGGEKVTPKVIATARELMQRGQAAG